MPNNTLLTRPKLWCRVFGHKFRQVIGSHDMAFFGREWEFRECLRCQSPNPDWVPDGARNIGKRREIYARPL